MDAIRGIRNARAEMNVPPSRKAKIIIVSSDSNVRNIAKDSTAYFQKLAYASEIEVLDKENDIPKGAVSVVLDRAALFIPLTDLLDIDKEMERLKGEADNLKKEISRAEGKLNNANFISKAPEKLVESEKEKLKKYSSMLRETEHRIDELMAI